MLRLHCIFMKVWNSMKIKRFYYCVWYRTYYGNVAHLWLTSTLKKAAYPSRDGSSAGISLKNKLNIFTPLQQEVKPFETKINTEYSEPGRKVVTKSWYNNKHGFMRCARADQKFAAVWGINKVYLRTFERWSSLLFPWTRLCFSLGWLFGNLTEMIRCTSRFRLKISPGILPFLKKYLLLEK